MDIEDKAWETGIDSEAVEERGKQKDRVIVEGGEGGGSGVAEKLSHNGDTYVPQDNANLAEMDAPLEKHLSRSWNVDIEARRQGEDWEVDLRRLVLKNIVARGTFRTVYRGIFNEQDVAVKLLDWREEARMKKTEIDSLRSTFQQEVAVWHKLDHPNITKFIGASMGNSDLQIPSYDQGSDGFLHVPSNVGCVVVEYLAGGTLKEFLLRHRRRKLTFKVVLQLALELSRGTCVLRYQDIVPTPCPP
eukprot:c4585_g2_i1 orf=180-917(+)